MIGIRTELLVFVFILLYSNVISLTWEIEDVSDSHVTLRVRRSTNDGLSHIRKLLRQARMENGDIDINSLFQKNIEDPIPISDFNISSKGYFTNIRGHFSNVELYGMKDFQLTKIVINLSKMNLSAEIFIPVLSFVGDYVLDGSLTFVQLSGNGSFWMNISSIVMTGDSVLEITPESQLRMKDVKLQSEVDEIKLHFEDLMGGGTWGSISNSLLNQLSELILDALKHSLLKELSQFLKDQFNDEVSYYLPKGFTNSGSSNIIDSILHQASKAMRNKGLDPLSMPNHQEKIEEKVFFVTTRGELNLSNGILHGLSSLYRKGDVFAILVNDSIILEANFGFDNLVGNYKWDLNVFGIGTDGFLEVNVKSIEGFIKLKQDLRASDKPHLDTFHINGIRHIWLDIKGLGAWDYLMEIGLNLVTNGLKMEIADIISGPVKDSIQKEIDNLNVTLI